MFVKNLSAFLFCVLANKVFFTEGEDIVEIGYGLKTEYTNWDRRPTNYTMIFHLKKIPRGILVGFSGYAIRSSKVVFQIWRERETGFELIQEYNQFVELVQNSTPTKLTYLIRNMPNAKCKRIIQGDYFGIHIPGDQSAFPLFFEERSISVFAERVDRKLNVVQNISKLYFPYGMSASAYIDTDDSPYPKNDENGDLECLPDIKIPTEMTSTKETTGTTKQTTGTTKETPKTADVASSDSGLDTKYLILIIVLAALLLIVALIAIFCFFKRKNQTNQEIYDRFREYPNDFKKTNTISSSKINFVTPDDIHNNTMSSAHSFT